MRNLIVCKRFQMSRWYFTYPFSVLRTICFIPFTYLTDDPWTFFPNGEKQTFYTLKWGDKEYFLYRLCRKMQVSIWEEINLPTDYTERSSDLGSYGHNMYMKICQNIWSIVCNSTIILRTNVSYILFRLTRIRFTTIWSQNLYILSWILLKLNPVL